MSIEEQLLKLRKEEGRIEADIANLKSGLGNIKDIGDENKLVAELDQQEKEFVVENEKFSKQVNILFEKIKKSREENL